MLVGANSRARPEGGGEYLLLATIRCSYGDLSALRDACKFIEMGIAFTPIICIII